MINLDVLIMGQPYRLACRDGEQKTLREAVAYLDAKMCALRDSGKVRGTDRIAVMAALSVAAEFLSVKSPQGPLSDMTMMEVKQKLESMHAVLDSVLAPQENLL
ncbi:MULTISPECIES: cell division protein ZapA [Oxalobacteraceae]|jgi:cell division protein ZapA|uniref:cell division protein ZapA n=1 Tax=Oxalobacteraceae TaxID=75682 RepID=UPI001152608E|nr:MULTISPECIES: cell division protein ZapA [Oxalobacteraceae]TQK07334.1 cell division protein ZapA [Herbaspirillum sp. SJZ107]